MTKEKVILIIGVLLLIALSIQSYSIYLLNNRVIELSRPNLAPSISSISKNLELKPASPNDKFFKLDVQVFKLTHTSRNRINKSV